MELEKLLELPFRNKCGQLARYILKTNWSPTLIGVKTGPLFSLGLLWPSVTLMFSTIFVPIHAIFTHPSDTSLISFLLAPPPSYITVQSAARTKTQLMRQKRNKRPLGKWLHCRQLASVYLYLFVFPYCVYLYLYFHAMCICIWFVFYTADN